MFEPTHSDEMAVAASQNVKERDYWLRKLSGRLNKSMFPRDLRDDESVERMIRKVTFPLTGNTFSRLLKLSNESDYTLHIVLSSVLVQLLYHYNGHRDIIFGAPIYRQPEWEERELINTVLALRVQFDKILTCRQLLLLLRETVVEAVENQNYPLQMLVERLEVSVAPSGEFPLFDLAILLENIHPPEYLRPFNLNVVFSFLRTNESIEGCVEFNSQRYRESTVRRIITHFNQILKVMLPDIDIPLGGIEIVTQEEKSRLLNDFNGIDTPHPQVETVVTLFENQVDQNPHKMAVIFQNLALSYGAVNDKANRIACFLRSIEQVRENDGVGILLEPSIHVIEAMMGIMKAGAAYVPIESSLPEERIKGIVDDATIRVLISEKRYIRILNRLQWECPSLSTFLCLDSTDIHSEDEVEKSERMERKLWEYIGETAVDDITGGGWFTSYTGDPFRPEEMEEFADNVFRKLEPLLNDRMRVLEIGCASGFSMYRIAPQVGFYCGTDLSGVIIEKNRQRVQEEGLRNISLACLAAHEIDRLDERNFDLVIMNSVIQSFHGHNYLRKVIRKLVHLVRDSAYIFIGDVMDQDLKTRLVREMKEFKELHRDKNYKTKTDWSVELFVSRRFFEDLTVEIPEIRQVECSRKIYTLENELTRFRYDALMTIDKTCSEDKEIRSKHRNQLDARAIMAPPPAEISSGCRPHHLAYIIYTSGTTGRPKGVLLENRNLVNYVDWVRRALELDQRDRSILTSSFAFDLGYTSIYPVLTSGGELHIIAREILLSVENLVDYIGRTRITYLKMTPSFFTFVVHHPDFSMAGCRHLKRIVLGGEEINMDDVTEAYDRCSYLKIWNHYGPTETTVGSIACMVSADRLPEYRRNPAIGKPIHNSRVYLFNDDRLLQPIGVPGEICISGRGVGRGYLNQPELTSRKFTVNPYLACEKLYRTGDLGRWLEDGQIEFLGRVDTQVKVRGYRIELAEIENRLLRHDDVAEALAVALPSRGPEAAGGDRGDKNLSAYFVPRDHREVEVSELREFLTKTLPDYMIPAYFVQLEKIPLTANNKVDMAALPNPAVRPSAGYVPPRDRIEQKLIEIWGEVLGIDTRLIGINDNFFELGGHSLRLIVALSKIHQEMNTTVPLVEIFKSPTVESTADYIRQAEFEVFYAVEAIEKREYYELSSAQKRLYYLQNINKDHVGYNTPKGLEIEGEIDYSDLETTFKRLIRRHESLRTTFEMRGKNPLQRIHTNVEFHIEYYHLDDGLLLSTIISRFVRPFDLKSAPLMRVGLIKVEETRHILMVDIHHIVTDAISNEILVRDFWALYSGGRLSPLKLQYKDFSQWQNLLLASEKIKKQETFWLKEFEDNIPVLNIPTDFPRPSLVGFRGSTVRFLISPQLTCRLNEIVAESMATLNILLLAAYYVLLSKYSGQEDIVVGTVIIGRRHVDLHYIMGLFVNMLAIRNQPRPEKTFREFLTEVREKSLNAYDNQDYQFEELVRRLKIPRQPGRHPLVDTVMALHNIDELRSAGPVGKTRSRLKIKPFAFEKKVSHFDYMLHATALQDGSIRLILEYSDALFKRSTMEKFAKNYLEILNQVAERQEMKLKEIRISHELVVAGKNILKEEQGSFGF